MPPVSPHNITGTIKDIFGNLLEGATVSVTHAIKPVLTTTTDSDGVYTVNLGNLDEQWSIGEDITIAANKTAEGRKTLTTPITSGGGQTHNLTLAETSDFDFEIQTDLKDRYPFSMVMPIHYDGRKVTRERPFPVDDGMIDSTGDTYVSAYLTNNGSNDMGIDGSTPVVFSYSPPANKKLLTGRMLVYMEASSAFDSTKFMNLTALTNGVQIKANENQLTNWKDNVDIVTDMFDVEEGKAFAKAGKVLRCRWTLTKAVDILKGITIEKGNSISVTIRDDLSAAGIIFRIKVQGILIFAP